LSKITVSLKIKNYYSLTDKRKKNIYARYPRAKQVKINEK